jgi:hypothetical protein
MTMALLVKTFPPATYCPSDAFAADEHWLVLTFARLFFVCLFGG